MAKNQVGFLMTVFPLPSHMLPLGELFLCVYLADPHETVNGQAFRLGILNLGLTVL